VTQKEAERIAAYLGEPVDTFRRRYIRNHNDPLLLKERSDGSCVFLDKKDKCTVYPVRPAQCRTYPFWDEVLANDFTWLLEKGVCPGIDQCKLYSPEEIDALRKNDGEAGGY
jgi:Fe-S-cluster containining protein